MRLDMLMSGVCDAPQIGRGGDGDGNFREDRSRGAGRHSSSPLPLPGRTMTGTAVAGEGDVTATPGSIFFTGASSGTWTAGPVTVTTYPTLRAGGAQVAFQASCTFQFIGKTGQTPVTGSETVTLTAAGSAKLQKGLNGVLLDGDNAEGPGAFGNKLTASSTRTLRTS